MTLTLSHLHEWRRQEKESPAMIEPPGGRDPFLKDLPVYLKRVQEEAGDHPAMWPEDCEALAVRELLEDIFRLRRAKLAKAAEINCEGSEPPTWRYLLPFEGEIWFSLTEAYRRLDFAAGELVRTGTWSGKWMPDKPGRGGR